MEFVISQTVMTRTIIFKISICRLSAALVDRISSGPLPPYQSPVRFLSYRNKLHVVFTLIVSVYFVAKVEMLLSLRFTYVGFS